MIEVSDDDDEDDDDSGDDDESEVATNVSALTVGDVIQAMKTKTAPSQPSSVVNNLSYKIPCNISYILLYKICGYLNRSLFTFCESTKQQFISVIISTCRLTASTTRNNLFHNEAWTHRSAAGIFLWCNCF